MLNHSVSIFEIQQQKSHTTITRELCGKKMTKSGKVHQNFTPIIIANLQETVNHETSIYLSSNRSRFRRFLISTRFDPAQTMLCSGCRKWMKFSPKLDKSFTARLSTYKQNKRIPSIAVFALFIETIDGIPLFWYWTVVSYLQLLFARKAIDNIYVHLVWNHRLLDLANLLACLFCYTYDVTQNIP